MRQKSIVELMNKISLIGDSSFTNPEFETRKFWEVETDLNPKPLEVNIIQPHDGRLFFFQGDKHGYILYALRGENEDFYRAVAYFKTHTLINSPILVETQPGVFIIENFSIEAAKQLGVTEQQTQHMLEYAGFVTKPAFRRQGYAGILFELMRQEVTRAVSENKLSFFDHDTTSLIRPENIVAALVASGSLRGNPNWERFKQERIPARQQITQDVLLSYNIDPLSVGVTRELSIGTEKLAKKNKLTYIGTNLSDGGPVYIQMIQNNL